MRKCDICKGEIEDNYGVTVTTDNMESIYMHQACFDSRWSNAESFKRFIIESLKDLIESVKNDE